MVKGEGGSFGLDKNKILISFIWGKGKREGRTDTFQILKQEQLAYAKVRPQQRCAKGLGGQEAT